MELAAWLAVGIPAVIGLLTGVDYVERWWAHRKFMRRRQWG